jgi:hypothetical protein
MSRNSIDKGFETGDAWRFRHGTAAIDGIETDLDLDL